MGHVYTGIVHVRHDELDVAGRVRPAAYLRYLAQAAVDASTAAGYDAAWYARAGALWIIRRSTIAVHHPARASERLAIRTWVEDFRRVRSQRRYEVHRADGTAAVSAVTDWVYVDADSGRPRRVPDDMVAAFTATADAGRERPPWSAPTPPAETGLGHHLVGYADLDSLGHMNNAAYLDVLVQATLDVLAHRGLPFEQLLVEGAVPTVVAADVEYLGEARYRDALETVSWFSIGSELEAHQEVFRADESRPLVRAATRWRWQDATRGTPVPLPVSLGAVLGPLCVT